MNTESTHHPLRVWVRWVLLTEVGFFGGWYVIQAISTSTYIRIGLPLTVLILSSIWGAVLGAAQWFELARHQPQSKPTGWIIRTSLGFSIGLLVGITLSAATIKEPLKAVALERALSALLIGAAVGFGVGIAQCLALRLKGADVSIWEAANSIGMALGCLAGSVWADAQAGGWGTSAGMLLLAVAGGLGLGSASGWSLQTIIRRRRQSQRELLDVF